MLHILQIQINKRRLPQIIAYCFRRTANVYRNTRPVKRWGRQCRSEIQTVIKPTTSTSPVLSSATTGPVPGPPTSSPKQHSLTTQTQPERCGPPLAASSTLPLTWHHFLFGENYSRRRCRQRDFTAGLQRLASQTQAHTYAVVWPDRL